MLLTDLWVGGVATCSCTVHFQALFKTVKNDNSVLSFLWGMLAYGFIDSLPRYREAGGRSGLAAIDRSPCLKTKYMLQVV